ncbi:hypothetical protein ACU4GD_14705 [Cupriavidus basilensis]
MCAVANRARAYFDAHSLDYDQLGVRLLPTDMYMEVADRQREFQDEFNATTAVFLADYPRLKEEARAALNGLFDDADYPTQAELAKKFGYAPGTIPAVSGREASSTLRCRPTSWTGSRRISTSACSAR